MTGPDISYIIQLFYGLVNNFCQSKHYQINNLFKINDKKENIDFPM